MTKKKLATVSPIKEKDRDQLTLELAGEFATKYHDGVGCKNYSHAQAVYEKFFSLAFTKLDNTREQTQRLVLATIMDAVSDAQSRLFEEELEDKEKD